MLKKLLFVAATFSFTTSCQSTSTAQTPKAVIDESNPAGESTVRIIEEDAPATPVVTPDDHMKIMTPPPPTLAPSPTKIKGKAKSKKAAVPPK